MERDKGEVDRVGLNVRVNKNIENQLMILDLQGNVGVKRKGESGREIKIESKW